MKDRNNAWHPARDSLTGTHAYGIPFNDENNWSIRFSHMQFNQYLFTSADRQHWLVADKSSVIAWYANTHRPIVRSSINANSYSARWYRRSGSLEDPWISIRDHATDVVYGGNSYRAYLNYVQNNGGAKVYIRQAPHRSKDSDACLKPPV